MVPGIGSHGLWLMCWSESGLVFLGRNVNKIIDDSVHHDCLTLLMAILKLFPSQILDHGGDAACSAIVILAESCCTSLDSLNLINAGLCSWVPDCSRVL